MTAVCESGWDWASNTFGQNPCAIAGALEAPCRGLTAYTLGPLNNTNYVPPPKGSALPCECSTVMYSLFMACTACQGEQVETWSLWDGNCDSVYVCQYPLSIPVDTAIPAWAYLNVTVNNIWDGNASEAVVELPESTGVGPSVVSIGTSSTSTRAIPSLSSTNGSNTKGGGSHAGAIAGGVVGGLAAIGILTALVLWFLMKRKRSTVAPSSAFMGNSSSSDTPLKFDQPPPQDTYPGYGQPPVSSTPFIPARPMTVYDPSDPSTFPTAFQDTTTGTTTSYPQTTYDPYAQRKGQYSGVPEV